MDGTKFFLDSTLRSETPLSDVDNFNDPLGILYGGDGNNLTPRKKSRLMSAPPTAPESEPFNFSVPDSEPGKRKFSFPSSPKNGYSRAPIFGATQLSSSIDSLTGQSPTSTNKRIQTVSTSTHSWGAALPSKAITAGGRRRVATVRKCTLSSVDIRTKLL